MKMLRQAAEHFEKSPEIEHLLHAELCLALEIWRKRKEECYRAGRELVRVFQNLSQRPQVAEILMDMN